MHSRFALLAAGGIIAGCATHRPVAIVIEPLPSPQATAPPTPYAHHTPTHAEIVPPAKTSCGVKASCSGQSSCSGVP